MIWHKKSERRRHIAKADAATERAATDEDKQRLLQLLSLWPDAPLDLADYLRQEVLSASAGRSAAACWRKSQDLSGQRLRFSEAELAQHFAQLQKQEAHLQTEAEVAQRLEERVRRDFLAVLHKHEPTDKSGIEHTQWRLRCAMQKLYLHDAEDRNANEAVATLRELAAGPLWEDVADALDPLRGAAASAATRPSVQAAVYPCAREVAVLGLIQQTAGGKVQIPRERKEVRTEGEGRPVCWPWRCDSFPDAGARFPIALGGGKRESVRKRANMSRRIESRRIRWKAQSQHKRP